ncbi:hypothetical protein B0T16DRAFT_401419 [Cercophora newfieldiana]|uniref:Carboxylesterase n=1 Tax=Cercophora newfieldiana TaxID=92897 RepID=A0AA39YRI8_9PEZI|nr:hypothetical protein B0T16DRAFT_401419 [Cercophora newfieldiana]
MVGYGSTSGIDMAPFLTAGEDVDNSLTNLLQAFGKKRLNDVKTYLYNDEARSQLAHTYGPPELLPLDIRYPEPVVAGYNIIREIFMGCNARRLGEAFPNSTYMLDYAHMGDLGMLSLYYDVEDGGSGLAAAMRSNLLHFIHTGRPGPWTVYTEFGLVTKIEGFNVTIQRDVFDNSRCRWWLELGYDFYHKILAKNGSGQA